MKPAAIALLLAIPALAQDQIWRWVDEHGEEHYTNDKASIPEKARAKATSTEGSELSVVSPTSGGATPPVTNKPVAAQVQKISKLVVFEASTNSASKALRKSGAVEKLIADNPGLKLERLEFASAVDRAEKLNVSELPTVLFLDDAGVERGRATGLNSSKQLQEKLDQARGTAR